MTFDHRDPDDAIYVDPAKVGDILRTKYKLEEKDDVKSGGVVDVKSKSTLTAAAAALSDVVDGIRKNQVDG